MKKYIYQSILLLSLAVVASCSNEYSEPQMSEVKMVNDVEVSTGNNIKLAKGMTVAPEYVVSPADATPTSLLFSTSDEDVATVDVAGKISALEVGKAYISITPANVFDVVKSLTVNVVPVASSIEGNSVEMYAGTEKDLSSCVTVEPVDAYDVFEGISSDEAVCTVADGSILAKQAGSAEVTVKTKDGSGLETKVEVKVLPSIPTESMTFEDGQELVLGATTRLAFSVTPADATIQLLNWTSSDASVATVDNKGYVTAKKYGTTTITVSQQDGTVIASTLVMVAGGKLDVFGESLAAFFGAGDNATVQQQDDLLNVQTTSKLVQFNFGKVAVNVDSYPIIACKISGGITKIGTEYFGFDIWTDAGKGNKYNNGAANGAAEGEAHFLTKDGNHVFFEDMSKRDYLKGKGMVETTRFYFKIGNNVVNPNYNIYWLKTFKSVEELKAYLDNN